MSSLSIALIALLAGSMASGQVITGKQQGALECFTNRVPTANFDNVKDLNNDLRDNGVCASAAKTCTRVACGNTSGVFLCNDQDTDIEVNCSVLADYADNVNANCNDVVVNANSVNGQQFDNRNFNIVVKGTNCNDPTTFPVGSQDP